MSESCKAGRGLHYSCPAEMTYLMKIINVVGARPNFMKIAPTMKACKASTIIDQLGITEPDINLEIGPASHAVQPVEIMKAFELVVHHI